MKQAIFFIGIITTLFAEEPTMQSKPYGSWNSNVTAELIARGETRFSEVKLTRDEVYWLETRPTEKGRVALMSWSEAEGEKEVLPKQFSVRTRVHEYGGGAFFLAGSSIYFIHDGDQQVYCRRSDGSVEKITVAEAIRFADGSATPDGKSLFYVAEKHGANIDNSIVKIDLDTKEIQTVASGSDFYSTPRVSPDGRFLCYLSWEHPSMPWDETKLWVLDLELGSVRLVAKEASESILDPQWAPNGELYYVSDRSNWWNLYRENGVAVCPIEAELALPQWLFARSIVGFLDDGIACSYVENGASRFAHLQNGELNPIDVPYTKIDYVSALGHKAALVATSPSEAVSIVLYDFATKKTQLVKASRKESFEGYISIPKPIEFPTEGGRTAHAIYYPPTNSEFTGLPGELPPLLVQSHGGPTAQFSPGFATSILFWTSRGFAVLSVNYGGSTGYGREYRDRLQDNWGIVDVDDCVNGAMYCVHMGLADRDRLAIEGGSAGGYTTLAALAFRDVFQVGADYFGVSDLEGLTKHTHKFEARYLDGLVGAYPEKRNIYLERSPTHHVESIRCPVIILQGDEDAIVPPSQSELIFDGLKKRGIPTAYLLFAGEQHGFRKQENIRRSLEAQLYFYSKMLKFPLSEEIEPVFIENFPHE